MAIRLELDNGLVRKYQTSYTLDETSTEESKCSPSKHVECDHIECGIYAAEYTAINNKSHFKIFFFVYIFWVLLGFFVGDNASLTGGGVGLICASFGIYSIWQSRRFAKKAKELIEFRDHGTINGIKAKIL